MSYIEREKVYDIFGAKQQALLKYHRYYQLNDADKEEFDLYDSYMNEVENIPAADVVEVVHGEWVKTDKGQKCSNCNCLSSLWDNNLKSVYCPWCGAKMDGERRSENES